MYKKKKRKKIPFRQKWENLKERERMVPLKNENLELTRCWRSDSWDRGGRQVHDGGVAATGLDSDSR